MQPSLEVVSRRPLQLLRAALSSLLLPALLMVASAAQARVHSNTQNRLPYGHYLADLTGDGVAEYLVVDGQNLYATESTFEAHGKLYARLPSPVKRLFTGHFGDPTREQVCTLHQDGMLRCYNVVAGPSLQLRFTQTSVVADDEHALVGDYDGNGVEDLLVYKPSTGQFRMYSVLSGRFAPMSNFNLGNLSNPAEFIGQQIRVGELHANASPRRDDLIVYDAGTGQVRRYSARTDANGQFTFWWAFTTGAVGKPTDELEVANVDGDTTEDIVFHDRATGTYRFFKAEYANGSLAPINTNYVPGQLFNGANATVVFAKLKSLPNEAGVARDDMIAYDSSTGTFVVSHARWSGFQYTYWWAFTQEPLKPSVDQDGDGISTRDELGAYDRDADGRSDVPLMWYGASPFVKDVFVEVDYMAAAPGDTVSHVFKPQAVDLAVAEMAKMGINLHVFVDQQLPYKANLGTAFNWQSDFDGLKDQYFTRARWPFFHYCIFGDDYGTKGSSGLSRNIPSSDFIVTLGGWDSSTVQNGSVTDQAGTFLHELGHNLGLLHGGSDSENWKPNFLSIMNYTYQFTGVRKDSQLQFLYSDVATGDLDESRLDENNGIRVSNHGNSYLAYVDYLGKWVGVNSAVDWNSNGRFDSSVRVNLNPSDATTVSVLKGTPNEYLLLQLAGGILGSTGPAVGVTDTEANPSRRFATILDDSTAGASGSLTSDERTVEVTRTQYLARIVPVLRDLPPLDLSKLPRRSQAFQPLAVKSAAKALALP